MSLLKYILVVVMLCPAVASAQNFGSRFVSTGFRNMQGYAGFGFAEHNVSSPDDQFSMNSGVFVYVGGERKIGEHGLTVKVSFNYMQTTGESYYSYSDLGNNSNYQNTPGTNVDFNTKIYQLALGLKQRLFPGSWLRPYVEGGGLFGYFDMEHQGSSANITCTGTCADPEGFKKTDALTGFGYYAEAGLEIDFSEYYGLGLGLRYQNLKTRPFETLGHQEIEFNTLVFQLAFQKSF